MLTTSGWAAASALWASLGDVDPTWLIELGCVCTYRSTACVENTHGIMYSMPYNEHSQQTLGLRLAHGLVISILMKKTVNQFC